MEGNRPLPNQGLVAHVCVAVPHLRPYLALARQGIVPGTASMTIVDKQWAFCTAGASDGHAWVRLDPKLTVIEALIFLARPKDGLVVESPPKVPAATGTRRAKRPADGSVRRRA
jgi:hypothetical protein